MSTGINPIVPGAGFVNPFYIGADGTAGQVLKTDGAGVLGWVTPSAGVTDHGALTGLGVDDHTIYALLAGRALGQSLTGGTGAGETLTLRGTSHGTPGRILTDPLTVTSPAAATVAAIIKGAASQSGNLLNLTNSADSVLASVDASGNLAATRVALRANNHQFVSNGTNGFYFIIDTSTLVLSVTKTLISTESAGTFIVGWGSFTGSHTSKTIQAESAVAGTQTDTAASDLVIAPGVSTGNAPPASWIGKSALPTTSGTGAQTLVNTLTLNRLNAVMGTAAIATNATDGFFYAAGCAGTPTGTPTTYTGRVPVVVDTTNHKLYFFSGGSWRDAGP